MKIHGIDWKPGEVIFCVRVLRGRRLELLQGKVISEDFLGDFIMIDWARAGRLSIRSPWRAHAQPDLLRKTAKEAIDALVADRLRRLESSRELVKMNEAELRHAEAFREAFEATRAIAREGGAASGNRISD